MISTPNKPARRWLLAAVLAVIALALLIGGVQLLRLGGSAYYLVAGLAMAACAWFAFRGDTKAIWLYGALLIATLVWAAWETGLNPWGMQARLVAPLVLGLWVCFPLLRRLGWKWIGAGAAVVLGAGLWMLSQSNRIESAVAPGSLPANGSGEWRHYANDVRGSRYAPLTTINAANVAGLKPAWTYHTGLLKNGLGFQTTPLMIEGTLYLCTPDNNVIALDAETGKQLWRINPKVDMPPAATCRGVSHYTVPDAQGPCADRIIFATTDARLMAVDSRTGAACTGFGEGGTVNLKHRMGTVTKGYYYVSSAPTIARNRIVIGGWVLDGQYVGEPSGVIRAFDAVTGQFVWAWDMDRPDVHTEPPEGQTYSRGTANSWAPMSYDDELGLVYAPTGNATPDYWGARRSAGSEKYSASVVALDINTGAAVWHFQTSHHDVWDYDVASQPTLVDLPVNGQTIPALVQPTKRGELFLLDRRTGKPLAAVEERPVPQGAAEGDWLTPTQPFSVGMPAFDRTVWTEATMWGATPLDQLWCRIKFREARYEGPMTPPGIRPSITYPSYLGGSNWGSAALDPERRLLVVNWNRMPNYTRMVPRTAPDARDLEASKDGGVHVGFPVPQLGTPFALYTGAFLSPLDMPCSQPPFGVISVVDLDTRKILWEKPLGSSQDSGPLDIPTRIPLQMGVPNQGGSLITRSGLVFIGATQEHAIRAFDIRTGRKLWTHRLPAGGNATPMTYISPKSGRQFVLIAAGGNASLRSGQGDAVIAFALPK